MICSSRINRRYRSTASYVSPLAGERLEDREYQASNPRSVNHFTFRRRSESGAASKIWRMHCHVAYESIASLWHVGVMSGFEGQSRKHRDAGILRRMRHPHHHTADFRPRRGAQSRHARRSHAVRHGATPSTSRPSIRSPKVCRLSNRCRSGSARKNISSFRPIQPGVAPAHAGPQTRLRDLAT